MPYLLIASNIILMSLGQILFKQAALFMNNKSLATIIEKYIYNPWLWAAVVVYGFATILWVYVLTTVKLNIAYPIMISLSYVLTLLGAYYFFGESIGLLGVVGIILILVGIVFVSF
jgi:multidrug transporter EmrE-like cation transporter